MKLLYRLSRTIFSQRCRPCLSNISSRMISGKALRIKEDKPKPFPYRKRQFNLLWAIIDKTSLRFDENTKVVIVDGAHAIGKTKFAKELADELDMLYVPEPTMDVYYINGYGTDLRDYNEYLLPRNKTFDEKDFIRNPMGSVEGSADRFILFKYLIKFRSYVFALRHLFNTGQGIVMEKSPFSDYIGMQVAFNHGWIDKTSRKEYNDCVTNSIWHLLRPNLIIYLDAPVDLVRKNISLRKNEWDTKSPLWHSSTYLPELYDLMKKDYLKTAQKHSEVLVYDWSDGGDTEVVVEDIERLTALDEVELRGEKQKDWILHVEDNYGAARFKYSNKKSIGRLFSSFTTMNSDCHHLLFTAEENINRSEVINMVPGGEYLLGYNTKMGDSVIFKSEAYNSVFDDQPAR